MFKTFEATQKRAVEQFFTKVGSYHPLTAEAVLQWTKLLSLKRYAKGDRLVTSGETAKSVAFVSKGLFSQYAQAEDGIRIIKRFFPEGFFAASTTSLLSKRASTTSIEALEDAIVLEYDFDEFRKLTEKFKDVSGFYIRYMEQHWILEKEPEEFAFRQYSARDGFERFKREYGHLLLRLKKQDIAAYLGITPTQMSRILARGASPVPPRR